MESCLCCDIPIKQGKRALFCSDLCRSTFNQSIKKGIVIKLYILKDPSDFSIFYVGRTVVSLTTRLKGHVREANILDGSKKRDRISAILNSNQYPIIELVEEHPCSCVEDEIEVNKREMALLKEFTDMGWDMSNVIGTKESHKGHYIRPLLKKFFSRDEYGRSDKIQLVIKKEGLQKYQQVIDFLLDEYWRKHYTSGTADDISEAALIKKDKNIPKTLEALKRLCPMELSGLDRSSWISSERVKYNL